MNRFSGWTVMAFAVAMATGVPAAAQNFCPPPPNPNFTPCPLVFDHAILTEEDLDLDGQPDTVGSTGGFCGGDSAADCIGSPAAEVSFDLIIPDPSVQDVTCTLAGEDIWIMEDGCLSCIVSGFGSVTLPAGTSSDGTLKVVVADVNGDVCVCGPALVCTFSKEVICDDGSDGDGDGLIDDLDPDCCIDADEDGFCGASDCDDSNPDVQGPPRDVEGFVVSKDGEGKTTLQWDVQAGSVVDAVTGNLSDLRTDGEFSLALCMADDVQGGDIEDTQPDPLEDDGYYYLLRQQNSCAAGGYGTAIEARDFLDETGPCPYDPDCPTCLFAECAFSLFVQEFGNGMVGCSGTLPFFNRNDLCSGGSTVCTAEEWVARRGGLQPFYNYWIDDRLGWGGGGTGCYATASAGGCDFDDPMRVCAGHNDALGNSCDLARCGYESSEPNEFFGGCTGGFGRAGALCCIP